MDWFNCLVILTVNILISGIQTENCPESTKNITMCHNGTYFNHNKQLCQTCRLCRVGEGVRCPCNGDTNTVCERCSKGTFSRLDSNRHCTPCTKCRVNEIRKSVCNKTHDAVCLAKERVKKVRKDHSTYIWIIVALGICFVLVMVLLIWAFYRTRGSLCQQAPPQPYRDYVSQQYHDTDASQASDAALCDGSSFSSLDGDTRWRRDRFKIERSSYSSLEEKWKKSKEDRDSIQSSLLSSDNYSGSSYRVLKNPDVLVNSLPASVYQDLGKLLNPSQQYKDWQTLAGKMGYTQTDIENWKLRSTNDFTETVLMDWCTRKPNATVRDLYKIIVEIPREDAASVLYNIDKSTSIRSEVTV
ncbi:uncharacterized protein LOC135688259 [Rhopilema esculentum]|uniref:uncharacterized protein LOC135688259 n=1 Tax=Rhopilema esculentum TaxID=499914 RepID=UPI0031DB916F